MLCSHCSERVRPVVAIDIDGTLADYHGHFWDFARTWMGVPVPDTAPIYDGSIAFKTWFCSTYNVDTTTFRSIKLAYRQGGMKRTQPLIFGASQLVNTLRQQAEVWLTTTRPHDRYDRVDPDTREWLSRNGIGYDGLLFNDDKIRELAERVDRSRVVAVLDDDWANLEEVEEYGVGKPILARNDYNRAVAWPLVAANLTDAYNMINVLVEDWTRSYG